MAAETETDPLADGAGADPFDEVPADAGAEPEEPTLVTQGELGGYNPSEEGEDPPAEPEPEPEADPLADPPQPEPEADAGTPWNPDEDQPEPEAEVEPAEAAAPAEEPTPAEPEPTPEPESEAAPEPEAEEKPKPKKSGRKSGAKKAAPARKSERGYVVVKCDDNDSPVGIAGEINARDDATARRKVFEGMEDDTARLCAVPDRYWNVKTLKAEVEQVRKVIES